MTYKVLRKKSDDDHNDNAVEDGEDGDVGIPDTYDSNNYESYQCRYSLQWRRWSIR